MTPRDPGYANRDDYSTSVDGAAAMADYWALDELDIDPHPDLDPLPPRPAWRPNPQGDPQ